jgi:hypothetical protein
MKKIVLLALIITSLSARSQNIYSLIVENDTTKLWNPYTGEKRVIVTSSPSTFSIGTVASTAPLTVANFSTSFPTPQAGTMIHLVSDAVTNGRLSFDTYNNASFTGSIFQGRRGRGSAASATAPIADDILVAVGGDGYGDDSFTGSSVGSVNIRANGTFTNASKPTYISFTTTPTGSTTQAERFRIKADGSLLINGYGTGAITGTPAYALQVDASGNVIEGSLSGGSGLTYAQTKALTYKLK